MTGGDIRSLCSIDSTIFIGTYQQGAFSICSNGITWSSISAGLSGYSLDVISLAIKDTNIFAGTDSGFIWKRPLSQITCGSTTVDENFPLIETKVYPNPFSHQFKLEISDNELTTVSLFDFLGRQILQQKFSQRTTINTEYLADGIYFYELRNNKKIIKSGKVIKL